MYMYMFVLLLLHINVHVFTCIHVYYCTDIWLTSFIDYTNTDALPNRIKLYKQCVISLWHQTLILFPSLFRYHKTRSKSNLDSTGLIRWQGPFCRWNLMTINTSHLMYCTMYIYCLYMYMYMCSFAIINYFFNNNFITKIILKEIIIKTYRKHFAWWWRRALFLPCTLMETTCCTC